VPAADGAGLHADEVLPGVLGLEVSGGLGLFYPGVEDDGVLEVLADDAELGLAGLGDDEGLAGGDGGGVDAVRLAGEGDGAGLGLGLEAVDLVDVGGVLQAGDLDVLDVLERFGCWVSKKRARTFV
jgi:hypothetical protein